MAVQSLSPNGEKDLLVTTQGEAGERTFTDPGLVHAHSAVKLAVVRVNGSCYFPICLRGVVVSMYATHLPKAAVRALYISPVSALWAPPYSAPFRYD